MAEELRLLLPVEFDGSVKDAGVWIQLKSILFYSKLNVLILFVPFGILSDLLHWGDTFTFVFNFLAIIPMAALLGYGTEEVALHTSQTIGGLLNSTFGNAVEVIIAIAALREGLFDVVRASLLGSILSNCLLVLGLCFLCGGWTRKTQQFNRTAAQTSASLLAISMASLIVPGAFASILDESEGYKNVIVSRGTSIVLLVIYCLYLVFQLKTHPDLFEDEGEQEEANLSMVVGIGLLVSVTLGIGICAEFLVGSIEGLSHEIGMSQMFVGMILLPIVGNAAEHVTAVSVAMKDKMNLAIGVAVGSSTQIALFVTPLMVMIGWAIGEEFTLLFGVFDIAVLSVSVFVVNYLIADGESNWLEGVMLLGTYAIISVAFYAYP